MQELIPKVLVNVLREARSVVALTGAGVSAESGIPTFRDALDGLWSKYDAYTLATPEGFAKDPALVTKWYDWRRTLCAKAQPNPAHHALARLQARLQAQQRKFTLVTQNVDRLHQAAGSTGVIELHGTLWVWRCTGCGEEGEERAGPFREHPPRCAKCGQPRRPGVIWFGEALPAAALSRATRETEACDLFFSIGTSSIVFPAAGLLDTAIARQIKTVEINTEETTAAGYVHWALQGKAGELLPRLVALALGE